MLIRLMVIFLTLVGLARGQTPTNGTPDKPAMDASLHHGSPQEFSVAFFPVAPHHIGDQLSARVTYSGQDEIEGQEITIALAENPQDILETTRFSRYSQQATFYWFLDSQALVPGFIRFQFSIPEMGVSWQAGVNLLAHPGGRTTSWTEVHTQCCTIYYIPETDAAEDIALIQQILEEKTSEALDQFSSKIALGEAPLEEKLTLVLIPSLIGQGGFATDIAVMTYSDRNWAGTDFSIIAHHEIVHVLDRQLNDGQRPSLFAEGLAVYFAGGHYRDGDPLQRSAALLELGQYIPIVDIVDDFYAAQHEISYLEAGGLVAFLVQEWGLEGFLDFYFNLVEAERDSESIAISLEDQFGMTLPELEQMYITHLKSINPSQAVQDDVRLTIKTYDLMRRYQKIRIPSAYFRSAWWPPVDRVLEMDIIGDYAAREKAPVEVIIENLFLEVYPALASGEVQQPESYLENITQLLDLAEENGSAFSHYTLGWPRHPAFHKP